MGSKEDALKRVEENAYNYLMEGKTQACSQTTLLAVQEELGQVDKLMIKACAPMAGGSRVGSLCGALLGGLLAIGIKHGVDYEDLADHDKLVESFNYSREFYKKFEEIAGSRYCPEIIGYDLDIPEEREKWVETGGPKKCAEICGKAAREALKLINKDLNKNE